MNIVVLGLSITSSWGNGHAVTYRTLLRGLRERGHDVVFLERDVPWYASRRDAPNTALLYATLDELRARFDELVRDAELVIVGSYVPDGVDVAEWVLATARGVTAFYDIDTPVTLAKLAAGDHDYLAPELVPRFDLYLSFTGGPTLRRLEGDWGARRACALYCAADPELYFPERRDRRWTVGYLGTYAPDRQPALERLLIEPARRFSGERFVVAGPEYPSTLRWPSNVERLEHVAAGDHRDFYARQAFTLNLTRADMIEAGWAPSVRLFEAAACGAPMISDWWEGLDDFFEPGTEIVVARDTIDVIEVLAGLGEAERRLIAERARLRVLAEHTPARRAAQLESEVAAVARIGA
jgi:spore maturation protein CgeB